MTAFTMVELASAEGADLGTSVSLLVDQQRIDAFAAVTEDRNWIHVDPQRAAGGSYGATIAHGYLTLSLTSHFLKSILQVTDAAMTINYGLGRVRFPSAVVVGSTLSADGRIASVSQIEGGLQAATIVRIGADTSAKPVCVAEVLTRFLRG